MNTEEKLIKSIGIKLRKENITVNGRKINYITSGSGAPVIFVHAMNIGWGEWYPNISEFANKFTVYAIDLPGCGYSSALNYSELDFHKDFINTIEKFIEKKKLRKVNLIGHSSGALIVLKLAQRNKIKFDKIIAVSPVGFSADITFAHKLISIKFLAKLLSKTVMKVNKTNISSFLNDVMQNKLVSDDFINYYLESLNRHKSTHPFMFLTSLLKNFKLKKELLLDKNIKIINEVLVIFGDKDPNIKPVKNEIIKSIIPNSKVIYFENCGHVPSIEYSNKFNEKVLQFIV